MERDFALLDCMHQQILSALKTATSQLKMEDHLTIVEGFGKFLAGNKSYENVGDVDVWLDETLCEKYWELIKILTSSGLKPVYDLQIRPNFAWEPCDRTKGHGLAFRVDCSNPVKKGNLDIIISKAGLHTIKDSKEWRQALSGAEAKDFENSGCKLPPEHFERRQKDKDLGLFYIAEECCLQEKEPVTGCESI